MKKLRVLEMIDRPFIGGGQMTLLRLARHLDKERFEVKACSAGGGPLVEELAQHGIPHFEASFRKPFSFGTVREIEKILKSNEIHILHTHGGISGLYGRWAGRRARTRVIVHTLHGIHYLHYRNPVQKRIYVALEKAFSRFTDGVICVSQADYRNALRLKLAPVSKLTVILNGLDFPAAAETLDSAEKRRELGLSPSDVLVGTVARLHRQKGLTHLVRAAERIVKESPGAMIVVIGGGPLQAALQKEIEGRNMKGRFFLLGERKDAGAVLSLLDIFVLPSLWEGLPYALIEAAAMGKPIVASDIDGVREVIRNGETGLLVPPADPGALSSAVLRLLKDKELAMKLGRNALAQIPPQFSLSKMIGETGRLYIDLWEKKSILRSGGSEEGGSDPARRYA